MLCFALWLGVGANNGVFNADMLRQCRFDTSILIERNVRFIPDIDLLQRRYGVHHVKAAAWMNNTELDFHLSRNDEAHHRSFPTRRWATGTVLGASRPALSTKLLHTHGGTGWPVELKHPEARDEQRYL